MLSVLMTENSEKIKVLKILNMFIHKLSLYSLDMWIIANKLKETINQWENRMYKLYKTDHE